jgi:hypothetical protein
MPPAIKNYLGYVEKQEGQALKRGSDASPVSALHRSRPSGVPGVFGICHGLIEWHGLGAWEAITPAKQT